MRDNQHIETIWVSSIQKIVAEYYPARAKLLHEKEKLMTKDDLRPMICPMCVCGKDKGKECTNEKQFEHICPVNLVLGEINTIEDKK